MGPDGKPAKPSEDVKLKEAQFHVHLYWTPETGATHFERGEMNRKPETDDELKIEYDHYYTAMVNGLAILIAHFIKSGKDRTPLINAVISKIETYIKTEVKVGEQAGIIHNESDIKKNPKAVYFGIVWEVKTGKVSLHRSATLPMPTKPEDITKEADDHLQTVIYNLGFLIMLLSKLQVPKQLLVKGVETAINKYLDQGETDGQFGKRQKISLETKSDKKLVN